MENPYFTNKQLEKTFYLTKEMLIERIESSRIDWNENMNQTKKKVKKFLKNPSN